MKVVEGVKSDGGSEKWWGEQKMVGGGRSDFQLLLQLLLMFSFNGNRVWLWSTKIGIFLHCNSKTNEDSWFEKSSAMVCHLFFFLSLIAFGTAWLEGTDRTFRRVKYFPSASRARCRLHSRRFIVLFQDETSGRTDPGQRRPNNFLNTPGDNKPGIYRLCQIYYFYFFTIRF